MYMCIYNTYFECVFYLYSFVIIYMIIVGAVIECAGNAYRTPRTSFLYGFKNFN